MPFRRAQDSWRTRLSACFRHGLPALLLLCLATPLPAGPPAASPGGTVRLALVNVPDELLRPMLPDFEKETGLRAEIVYTGSDPYGFAREGKADLVISHFGHAGVEPFVTEGLGLWPRAVFSNQMALIGPPADPAGIRGMSDAARALRRIADTGSPFLANHQAGARYLEEILWLAAGVKEKGSWYLDTGARGGRAVNEAAEKGAYLLWGLPPFLRFRRENPVDLVPLVTADPVFQRMMVSVVVSPEKIAGVNADGAKAFQDFLVAPATQARVRAFRYPDFEGQAWWPAGRENSRE
jgi:tungstate transport system substrate-binding protein